MAQTLETVIQEAEALQKAKRPADAIALYESALTRWPDQPGLLYNLGNLQLQTKDFASAAKHFRRVTELAPQFSWAHHNLGQCLLNTRRESESSMAFQKALSLDPQLSMSRIALATLLIKSDRHGQALLLLEEGARLQPSSVELQIELGNVLRVEATPQAALAAYERALARAPDSFAAHFNIGTTLHAQGDTDLALPYAQRALELRPDSGVAHEGLANILAHQGEIAAAQTAYAAAARLKPSDARRNLGLEVRAGLLLPPIPQSTADIREARSRFARSIEALRQTDGSLFDPMKEVGAVTPFYLAYHGLNNRRLLSDLAAMYRDICPALNFVAGHCEQPLPKTGRAIRVGIVSTYLRDHTVGRYVLGLVKELARPEFEVFVFTTRQPPDATSEAFKRAADHHAVLPNRLGEMQKQLGDAQLDVLLYADIGMEPVTYFLAFSRLAPVQCAFYGHPDTTGVDTIDHHLSWASAESDDAADWYSERLALLSPSVTYAHLPKVEWAGRPADRSALGVASGERLYTCVQTPYKLHPDFDDLLAGILESDPQARIRLVQAPIKAWGVALTQRLTRRLGPLMSRVAFLPFMARADYMALLAASDVVLDTPHFSGGGTTLDAIATATPVVTLAGPTLRSSQTRALFGRMGVADGISGNGADYVRRAVEIASRSELRTDISQRMAQSRELLFEDVGMVREVEALFRQWVAQAPR